MCLNIQLVILCKDFGKVDSLARRLCRNDNITWNFADPLDFVLDYNLVRQLKWMVATIEVVQVVVLCLNLDPASREVDCSMSALSRSLFHNKIKTLISENRDVLYRDLGAKQDAEGKFRID